jgi:hypothetical protein
MALPKLNLRDLFWLVVVVAMGLGWWLEHDRFQEAKDKLDLWPQKPGDKLEVSIDERGEVTEHVVGSRVMNAFKW